jgi:hypothetical protein
MRSLNVTAQRPARTGATDPDHAQVNGIEVSAELEARAVTAKKLQEDAKAAEALAGLHKEQAEAVRRMLDAELAGTARRIRRDAITIGLGSFAAGGAVSFLVTLFVHPLH